MSLSDLRREFKENYFINIREIWKDYFLGRISLRERDTELGWYRDKLNKLIELEDRENGRI